MNSDRQAKARMDKVLGDLRRQLEAAVQESHAHKVDLQHEREEFGGQLKSYSKQIEIGHRERSRLQDIVTELTNKVRGLSRKEQNIDESGEDFDALLQQLEEAKIADAANQAKISSLEQQLTKLRKVWVMDQEKLIATGEEQWIGGTIKAIENEAAVIETDEGEEQVVTLSDLQGQEMMDSANIADMSELSASKLSDPSILNILEERYAQGATFTFVGSVLLHIPKPDAPPRADTQVRHIYRNCEQASFQPPHIYSVLETAYRTMRMDGESQSVIITGERGSGKSSLARLSLGYLTLERSSGNVFKLLDALIILDAFSCVRTSQSKCASFGSSLYEVQFDSSGTAIGASIASVCFDKHRLTSQKPGDYNFAVFYQMCAGASEAEKSTLHLKGASKFPYLNLNRDDTDYHDYVDEGDAERYRRLKNAMSSLGLGNVERAAILRVLSAILWLGDVRFVPDASSEHGTAVWDVAVVDVVANLLRVDSSDLEAALTTSSALASSNAITDGNNDTAHNDTVATGDAIYARDALAQALYTRVFNWLVERANALLQQDDAYSVITIFDVSGFEAQEEDNDFGAFCRNYTNECVQELFNKMFFEAEQQEYEAEEISQHIPGFNFPSNSGCVKMIEQQPETETAQIYERSVGSARFRTLKPPGVIALLDEECQFSRTSEAALLTHLNRHLGKNEYYSRSRSKGGFNIKHCGGTVHYSVDNFVVRNRDYLPERMLGVMDKCRCKFLNELFPSSSRHGAATRISRPVTYATQLKNQLAALFRNLTMTTPYFVRCIAPFPCCNEPEVDSPFMLRQLRSMKLVEMLKLRHEGFPVRSYFHDFFRRYKIFSTFLTQHDDPSGRTQCEFILENMHFDRDSWRIGRSKVYLKEQQLELLEERREAARTTAAKKLQSYYRFNKFYRMLALTRECSLALVPILNGILARQVYIQMKENENMAQQDKESGTMERDHYQESNREEQERRWMAQAEAEMTDVQKKWQNDEKTAALRIAENVMIEHEAMMSRIQLMEQKGYDAQKEDPFLYNIPSLEALHGKASLEGVVQEYMATAQEDLKLQMEKEKCEREAEARACQIMEAEERYIKAVRKAIKRRKEPHPLEELASMRAEDAIAQARESNQKLVERLEAISASVAGIEKRSAKGGEDGPVLDAVSSGAILEALELLVHGVVEEDTPSLAVAELERVESEEKVIFSEALDYPIQIQGMSVENPVEYDYDDIDYNAPWSDEEPEYTPRNEEAAGEDAGEDAEEVSEPESLPDEDDVYVPPPATNEGKTERMEEAKAISADEVAVPAVPEDDRAAIQRMIEERRKARQPSRPVFTEGDDLFADLDKELNTLSQTFFTTSEDGDLEFDPQDEDQNYKHRFKYLTPTLKGVRPTR